MTNNGYQNNYKIKTGNGLILNNITLKVQLQINLKRYKNKKNVTKKNSDSQKQDLNKRKKGFVEGNGKEITTLKTTVLERQR